MIPKIIHYCWFGESPLPPLAKRCINSWQKIMPDYQIIEWNESNYDVTRNKFMADAYREKKWGFVPDYARLDIIYEHGGIYLDTDVEVLKPFDPLLEHEAFAGFEFSMVALGLGFGACQHQCLIQELRDSYDHYSFYDKNQKPAPTPAPQLQTAFLRQKGLQQNDCFQEIKGMCIYPMEYFCPKSYKTGILNITPNTYSIHHYDASWYSPAARRRMKWKHQLISLIGENNFMRLWKVYRKFK